MGVAVEAIADHGFLFVVSLVKIISFCYHQNAMEITYLGHSSFQIKGKDVTIITDPFDPKMVGFSFPQNITADIATISHDHGDHNYLAGIAGEPFIVNGPGEYEVKGVRVFGIESDHDSKNGQERGKNTLYLLELEDLAIVHLGDLGRKLNAAEVEELNHVDILMIPTGGTYTINPEQAAEVVTQLEPYIVIPMHYHPPEADSKLLKELAPVEKFLEQMGVEAAARNKLKMTKSRLPEETEVVVLQVT